MKKVRINPFSTTARPEQPIKNTHDFVEALDGLDEAFRKKFSRDPGLEDPIFFDRDADQPQVPTESQRRKAIDAMYQIHAAHHHRHRRRRRAPDTATVAAAPSVTSSAATVVVHLALFLSACELNRISS